MENRAPVAITLEGREYDMLPTFEVWRQIEEKVGPLATVRDRVAVRQVNSDIIADIAVFGLNAANTDTRVTFTQKRVLECMFKDGPQNEALWRSILDLLDALAYTPEQLAKKRAEESALAAEGDQIERVLSMLSSLSPRQGSGGAGSPSGLAPSTNSGPSPSLGSRSKRPSRKQ